MSIYKGNKTKEISFPLGGIGSGSIGLSGNGRLTDWEIFNRPFKQSANGFSHICVKAEDQNGVIDTRVLQGDYLNCGTGGETVNVLRGNGGFGFGMGPYRGTMAGVPHFESTVFSGEFPFAEMTFADKEFPGEVSLLAFNPFIPLNDKDSSIPAAFFEITFSNNSLVPLDYTACFSLNNLLPYGTTINTYEEEGKLRCIKLESSELEEDELLYGSFCIATDHEDTSYQEYWYRAEWFDSLQTFWTDMNKQGKLQNRNYQGDDRVKKVTQLDGEDMASLAAHVNIKPGETRSVRFVLSWYFPNCINYWNPSKDVAWQTQWKNYYASLFTSAKDAAVYSLQNWSPLFQDTKLFKDTLYKTSLPSYALEAVSANLSILKSPTCLRLFDGSFYGFEGCNMDSGCCEGSCSHVWNYAYALPFLFPKLERSMRDLEFKYSQREDGAVSFRLMLPLGRERYEFRPCVDGQMGGVIKTYRDYKMCGDKKWLLEKWPNVKKSIEFAWAPTNEDKWDADKDGVMEGRQHHTLDMELFGPSAWLNGFYQAALKAGAEMAEILGYKEEAQCYQNLYESGKKWVDANLFNGEYYQQQIKLDQKEILTSYNEGGTLLGKDSVGAYWNEEIGEIKYQIANGSSVDQVIGQWHANLMGLGEIFDKEQVRSSLQSIYRYNFKTNVRNEFNAARIYCMNDEGGVQVCAWPKGAKMPGIPITYSNEVMCGMEYQAASHMIWEGMIEEGLAIVKAVRERFDGERRNPWNEFECGSNYARSMASYALIPSISGMTYDMSKGYIGFAPRGNEDSFETFWSVDSGWGSFSQEKETAKLEVLYGRLKLQKFGLMMQERGPSQIYVDGRRQNFVIEEGITVFEKALTLEKESVISFIF